MNNLVPLNNDGIKRLYQSFIEQQKPQTRRAYQNDVAEFAKHLGVDPWQAGEMLLSKGNGEANLLVHGYKAHMLSAGYAGKTINRRMAALRSLVKMAKIFGMIAWDLSVQNVKAKSYRDTRGPTLEQAQLLLATAKNQSKVKAARDVAILRICFCEAMRRAEVYSLDIDHFDMQQGTVSILGKGQIDRETLQIPHWTLEALKNWVAVRGNTPGPMFPSFQPGKSGQRLTGNGFYHVITNMAKKCGLKVRPHALRHSAITTLLNDGQSPRDVRKLSRHASLATLDLYDDNRHDSGGAQADRLDELLGE